MSLASLSDLSQQYPSLCQLVANLQLFRVQVTRLSIFTCTLKRSSLFLITHTESLDEGDLLSEFSRASTGSGKLGLLSNNSSLRTLATTLQERQ